MNKKIPFSLLVLSALTMLPGLFIMTDVGQMIKIPRETVISYFRNSTLILGVSFVCLLGGLFLVWKYKLIKKKWIILMGFAWFASLIIIKYLNAYILFSAQQYDAEYVNINDVVDGYIDEDERVLVVNYNGVQKAFPPERMWISHIFGGDYNGENLVFTYCVMSDLGKVFPNEENGNEFNYKVLAQTNNNLLLWDTKSDDIIQQITGQRELADQRIASVPVAEMSWRGFKKLYPKGQLMYNEWNTPIEKMANTVFETEQVWYGEDWMFDTARRDDTRLPEKEHIIGIEDAETGAALAMAREYLIKNTIVNVTVGNRPVTLAWFPEYEAIMAFERPSKDLIIDEISPDGKTPNGLQLEQSYVHIGVMWAIWTYYFPNTDVFK